MVSIVVPVYNAEKSIKKCIESIVNEDVSFPYEIILINDGSKDNSINVLKLFANHYNNIKILEQNNQGVSSARNLGISNASGEWIMFLDADDFLYSGWSKIVEKYLENKCDFIIFSNDNYEENDEKNVINMITGIQPKYNMSCIWSKMYRLEIIKQNNLKFQEGIINGEDALFNLEYYLKCKNINFEKAEIYNYSPNNLSATNSFNSKFLESDMLYQSRLQQILKSLDKDYEKNSKISALNAWLVFFNRYSYKKSFNLKDFEVLLKNEIYMNVIDDYSNYSKYFSRSKRILLILLHYKRYKLVYLSFKLKNKIKKLLRKG